MRNTSYHNLYNNLIYTHQNIPMTDHPTRLGCCTFPSASRSSPPIFRKMCSFLVCLPNFLASHLGFNPPWNPRGMIIRRFVRPPHPLLRNPHVNPPLLKKPKATHLYLDFPKDFINLGAYSVYAKYIKYNNMSRNVIDLT